MQDLGMVQVEALRMLSLNEKWTIRIQGRRNELTAGLPWTLQISALKNEGDQMEASFQSLKETVVRDRESLHEYPGNESCMEWPGM